MRATPESRLNANVSASGTSRPRLRERFGVDVPNFKPVNLAAQGAIDLDPLRPDAWQAFHIHLNSGWRAALGVRTGVEQCGHGTLPSSPARVRDRSLCHRRWVGPLSMIVS